MFIYSIFMIVMFFLSFFYGIYLYVEDLGLMMEWLVYSINSINIEMFVLFDWVSMIFISVVMLISSMVMFYSVYYMLGDLFIFRFYLLVFMFIISMILMIVSPNLISILLGWDGLGLVSYCLVIYYQNLSSYNSGMITVLSNRVGDVGLLMSIGLSLSYGSWNIFIIGSDILVIFLIFMAAITKSAQIPFSYWLPQAMAAPTPVSSLVHSSTLVTAGVYLMIRFNSYICETGLNYILLILSMLTSLMSGIMANFEFDLKKIIALSTLSQLGLMMVILSVGLVDLAFYHLIIHALFKSLLFLCSGVMIHQMLNNQDIRFYGSLNEFMPLVMMSFYISSLALCGAPFMSGFYSKDVIVEAFNLGDMNLLMSMMIILSLTMTVSYTFRLFYYVFFSEVMFYYSWFKFNDEWSMNMSMSVLVVCSIVSGSMFSWLFFFDIYESYMSFPVKLITITSCMLGIFLGMMFCFWFFKFYFFSYFISSMWMTMFFYSYFCKPAMAYGCLFNNFDKTWIEYNTKYLIMYMFEKFKMLMLSSYKIFMFMAFSLIFCLIFIF